MSLRNGKDVVWLFRTSPESEGHVLAFQTDGSEGVSNDVEVTKTKSGSVTSSSGVEIKVSCTAIASTESKDELEALKKACKDGTIVECWKANLDQKALAGENKYKGTYYKGRISEYTENEGAEDHLEAEISYTVEGKGADGDVTVSTEDIEVASYVFTDTTA